MKTKLMQQRAWVVLTAAFIAGAAVLFCLAMPLWEERAALLAQQQQLEQRTSQIRQFAVRHNDYAAYAAKSRHELELLQQQFPQEPAVHAALEILRGLAVNNEVIVREVKLPEKEKARKEKAAQGIKAHALQLSGTGDFFGVLRWLRQAERQGFAVQGLRLQEEGAPGSVRIDLEIALYAAE